MELHLIAENQLYPISVRQFGDGAKEAAKQKGITVIIDVFRASNTIIELIEAETKLVPVETIDEARKYEKFIKIGETNGVIPEGFDFDNSPIDVYNHRGKLEYRDVVIRTTNGTRGIINAIGSEHIIIGSFRNFDAVVRYCEQGIRRGLPISFVAMGSKEISRTEDLVCAKMMYYSLLERLDKDNIHQKEIESKANPWNTDWMNTIISSRPILGHPKEKDRLHGLQLNKTKTIPYYDQIENRLKRL